MEICKSSLNVRILVNCQRDILITMMTVHVFSPLGCKIFVFRRPESFIETSVEKKKRKKPSACSNCLKKTKIEEYRAFKRDVLI